MRRNIGLLLWVVVTMCFAMGGNVIYAQDEKDPAKTYESQLLDDIDRLIAKEEFYEAIKDCSELIADWPESKETISAELKMASVYLKLGEYKRAYETVSRAKDILKTSNFDWQHDEADQYFAQALKFCTRTSTASDFDKARVLLNRVIERFPNSLHHARALNRIGCSYIHQQLYDKAVEPLQEVIKKFPDTSQSARAQRWLAKDYLLNKKYDESIKQCQQIIKVCEKSKDPAVAQVYHLQAPWAQYLLAQNYHQQRRYDQATAEYQRLADMYTDHPLHWIAVFEKGRCLYFNKHYKDAIAEFQKIVETCKKSKFFESARQNIKDINQILEREMANR